MPPDPPSIASISAMIPSDLRLDPPLINSYIFLMLILSKILLYIIYPSFSLSTTWFFFIFFPLPIEWHNAASPKPSQSYFLDFPAQSTNFQVFCIPSFLFIISWIHENRSNLMCLVYNSLLFSIWQRRDPEWALCCNLWHDNSDVESSQWILSGQWESPNRANKTFSRWVLDCLLAM